MIQNIECFFAQTFLIYAYMSDLKDLFRDDIFPPKSCEVLYLFYPQLFLLYEFPPKSCEVFYLFYLIYFCCTCSLQSLVFNITILSTIVVIS